jgi:hypothetical protein
MHITNLSGIARVCFGKGAFHLFVILLLCCCTLTFVANPSFAAAQAAQGSTPAQTSTPAQAPTAPSAGKALICIFRTSRFTGSASHDELFVNGVHLAKLLNGEYACTETEPGTVVISGLTKMYYGSAIMSAGAALNDARKKENERIRFEAETGKAYYLKWTAGTMATDIKVTPVDAGVGAKEVSKLHASKPPDAKDAANEQAK